MKAVLLSVKPEWWEKILSGEKTLEIRKTAPRCGWPVRVFVYVSGTGEIRGEFISRGCVKTNLYTCLAARSMVPLADLEKYGQGKPLCGWDIDENEVMEYDQGEPLASTGISRPPVSWQYFDCMDDIDEKED